MAGRKEAGYRAFNESYEMILRRHLIPALGSIPIQKLLPAHVARYKTDKLAAGRSPRTVAYHLTVLQEALEAARKRKLIRDNPAKDVDKPRYEAVKYHVYGDNEVATLIEVTRERQPALYCVW